MTSVLASLRPLSSGSARPASVRCLPVKLLAYWVVSGERAMPEPVRRHLDGCLNCQAEMARERQLIRGLSQLADELETAPAGLGSIIYGASPIDNVVGSSSTRWVLGATLASVSAGAFGVALVLGRRLRAAVV